jgi:hypothetical protein
MKYTLILIAAALGLASCYNQRKAEQQTQKALGRYPAVVADVARAAFPCNELLGVDSSGYYLVKRQQDSVYLILDSALEAEQYRGQELRRKLTALLMDSAFAAKCGASLSELTSEGDELRAKNADLLARLRQAGQKPATITRWYEDSAKVYLATRETARAMGEASTWKAKYEAENALRVELQKRVRGKVLVPWWVLVLIAAGLGLYTWGSIRKVF